MDTRVSVLLVTALRMRHGESAGLFATQRDAAAEETKLHRIAAQRCAGELNFGALDEAEYHQALYLWVRCINRLNSADLPWLQRRERMFGSRHPQMIMIRIKDGNKASRQQAPGLPISSGNTASILSITSRR